MAAFALSSIQCDEMGDFLEKIRVIQADTLSLIQGGLTAGLNQNPHEKLLDSAAICWLKD